MCVLVRGDYRIGLNEVAIGISPPGFAIELTRSRVHPAWLSRTVTLGEMFEPDDALAAGFLDCVVAGIEIEQTIDEILSVLGTLHANAHALPKRRLRHSTIIAMREAIDREQTLDAYTSSSAERTAVVLQRGDPTAAGE